MTLNGSPRTCSTVHDKLMRSSLYDLLAEYAPAGTTPGQTNSTKAKETIDNDVERFAVEELLYGS